MTFSGFEHQGKRGGGKMTKRSTLFSIALGVLVFNSAYAKKTPEQYWAEAGVSVANIDLTTASCNASEKEFIACFHALNMALAYEKKQITLVPASRIKDEKGYGAVVKDFTSAAVVEAKKIESEDFAEIYAFAKSEKVKGSDAIVALYKTRTTQPVDFDAIFTWVKGGTEFKAKEAAVVASMINSQIGILKDPHTRFESFAEFQDSNTAGSKNITGIGVTLKSIKKNGKSILVVQNPLEGGPAFKAGIRANDVITQVDGVVVEGMEFDKVVEKIRGDKGTVVKITVERSGSPITMDVTRDLIEMKNVTQKLLGAKQEAAYIKLSDFMTRDADGNTMVYSETAKALTNLMAKKPKGIIFDLRDNGGGLLTESVRIASLFLKKKSPVVSTKSLSGGLTQTLKTFDEPLTDLPLVVLINPRSASASEIVAGALQDHQRAFLIGERSFGKGTVQNVSPLNQMNRLVAAKAVDPIVVPFAHRLNNSPDILAFHTIQYFLLPSGRSNQVETVQPDVEIFTSPTPTAAEKVAFREEDEYAVLPAPLGKKWVQPRPAKVSALNTCLAKGSAKKTFADDASAAIAPDYQLLVAVDAVNCITDEKLWSPSDKAPTWGDDEEEEETEGKLIPFKHRFRVGPQPTN